MNTLDQNMDHVFAYCPSFNLKYQILGKLGEGSTSNVFRVRERTTGNLFALKSFNHLKIKSTHNF